MDFKGMLGSYVMGNKLGEFRYSEGTLLKAFKRGQIVILENY